MITARIADENRIESFCIGADDYIAKPYTPHRIFQAVEQAVHWFDQSRSGQIQVSVSFDHGDDGEILRRLGQFRSLVFARTALSLEAVASSAGSSRKSGVWPKSRCAAARAITSRP